MPTLPEKGYSGTAIKSRVVQAMAWQLDAQRAAFAELDKLDAVLGRIDMDTIPPPPAQQLERQLARKADAPSPGRYRARRPLDSQPH